MRHSVAIALAMVVLFVGCASKALAPVAFQIPTRNIDYLNEVKPVLDRRCAVCHSCYNSPCQLKLDSFEGADRGATKRAVYNATRLKSMDPTRLFTDAQTTGEWRQKEFISVTDSKASGGSNDSLMIELLSHKMKNPKSVGEYKPEADDLTCAGDQEELGGYLKKHPNRGMPFGFPPLKQEEFEIVAGWLIQGAKGPDAAQQKIYKTLLNDFKLEKDLLDGVYACAVYFNKEDNKIYDPEVVYEHFYENQKRWISLALNSEYVFLDLNYFNNLLREVKSAKTNNEKKNSLELLAEHLFLSIRDFTVLP